MVSFIVTSAGQRKNLSPPQDSNLWPSRHRALYPMIYGDTLGKGLSSVNVYHFEFGVTLDCLIPRTFHLLFLFLFVLFEKYVDVRPCLDVAAWLVPGPSPPQHLSQPEVNFLNLAEINITLIVIVLFHIIETCLQILFRLYQTECLQRIKGCGNCKLVEGLLVMIRVIIKHS